METADSLENRAGQFPTAVILGVAAAALAALMLHASLKWTLAALLTAVLVWLLVIFDSRRLLLGLLILSMPLMISKNIIPHDLHMGGPFSLDIIPMDIFLLGLYVHWFFSWLSGQTSAKRVPAPFVISIIGLLFFCVLSLTQAVDVSLGLFELWRIVRGILLFVYVYMNLNLEKDLNMIVFLLLAGLAIQSLIAASQYFFNTSFGLTSTGETGAVQMQSIADFEFKRVSGSFTAPSGLASYLGLLLPMALGLLIVKVKRLTRWIAAGIVLVAGATLILTMSRGFWLATAIAFAIIIIIATLKRLIPLGLSISLALTGALGLVLVNYVLGNLLWLRLFASDPISYYARTEMIGAALDAIAQRPILGLGLNNYTEVVKTFEEPIMGSAGIYFVPVHNSYLLTAADIGIPGALFFFSIYFWTILAAFRGLASTDKTIAVMMLGIIGGLSVVLIGAFSDWLMQTDIIFFMVWLMAAIAAATVWELRERSYEERTVAPGDVR